jgi:hypothetical protein
MMLSGFSLGDFCAITILECKLNKISEARLEDSRIAVIAIIMYG